MRYSNPLEIVAITVVWAVVLIVVKNALTPTPTEQAQASFQKPQVAMYIRHVGCNEQYKEVERALNTLPWLGELRVERGQPPEPKEDTGHVAQPLPHTTATVRPEQPEELCAVRIFAEVQDVPQADFMELSRVLRDIGIVPATMEFGGLPRFALQTQVTDLSCASCEKAAIDALTPLPVSASYYFSTTKHKDVEAGAAFKFTTFEWLDQKRLNQAEKTITTSVHPHGTARVQELIRALERGGFLPTSVRIVVDKA